LWHESLEEPKPWEESRCGTAVPGLWLSVVVSLARLATPTPLPVHRPCHELAAAALYSTVGRRQSIAVPQLENLSWHADRAPEKSQQPFVPQTARQGSFGHFDLSQGRRRTEVRHRDVFQTDTHKKPVSPFVAANAPGTTRSAQTSKPLPCSLLAGPSGTAPTQATLPLYGI